MSIFDSLGGQQNPMQMVQQLQANPAAMQMVQQLQANPAAMLRSLGLNIPDGMSNPQQIARHLVQSGQVPNSRRMMGRR